MKKTALGIDISKKKFDAAVLFDNNKIKSKKFENSPSGFVELMAWLDKLGIKEIHACMEATGNYGDALAIHLYDAGYVVSVVNPAQIKGFAQSTLSRNKNDRQDSKLIAHFCKAINPKSWQPTPLHIRELQDLVRRLKSLQNLYFQENNRSHVASAIVIASIEAVKLKLDEEIEAIKKQIESHINQHPELSVKQALLDTIPGIGNATIGQVLAFMSNIEDFKNAKQMSAFMGLNPKHHQSGSSVSGRTRISKTGNSDLRKAFYLPAIVAKTHNPVIKAFCQRLKVNGKPTMVIICAAMRKLVHVIYGVLKSGKPFNATLVPV